MCSLPFVGPSIKIKAPQAPEPPPPPQKEVDAAQKAARDREKAKGRLAGYRATILTSPSGLNEPVPTAPKTLLGQ